MNVREEEIKELIRKLPVFSEINLDALENNVRNLKSHIGDEIKLLAVVKDDAYGHGALEVSRSALSGGADYLGVVSVNEGLQLRDGGISAPTLILGKVWSNEIEESVKENLELTIFDEETAKLIDIYSRDHDKISTVFIKVDTGMGRLGLLPDEARKLVDCVSRLNNLKLMGLVSHFPVADEDDKFTLSQLKQFNELISDLREKGYELPLNHIANSTASISYPDSYLGMVRVGLSLYGYYPTKGIVIDDLKLKKVMSLRVRIAQIREVKKGISISYKRDFITDNKTSIAVVPIGYANGYTRALSNKAKAIYDGQFIQQVGVICMDMSMFDIGLNTKAEEGDVITLLGCDGGECIGADELSEYAGTIPYEILTNINGRVPKVFIKGGKIINFKMIDVIS